MDGSTFTTVDTTPENVVIGVNSASSASGSIKLTGIYTVGPTIMPIKSLQIAVESTVLII